MKNLLNRFAFIGSLFLLMVLSAPVLFADGDQAVDPVQAGGGRVGLTGIGGVPREPGITPPYTMIGGGRYRDGNGTIVVMTGSDGQERFEYDNPADREAYEASQDAEWQKHKGKFPGTYREWKDLQQYKDGNLGGGLDNYDFGPTASIGSVDTTGLSQIDDQHASADIGEKGYDGY